MKNVYGHEDWLLMVTLDLDCKMESSFLKHINFFQVFLHTGDSLTKMMS